jgi:hypothetical protein
MNAPIEVKGLLGITDDEAVRIYHTRKALEAVSDIALSAANGHGSMPRTITVTAEGMACLLAIFKEQLEINEMPINLTQEVIE